MNALVLGGSVFVGRRLVEQLVANGHHVTVLNRGRTATELPSTVQRVVADRTDRAAMREALAGRSWDVIYDVSGFVMAAGGSDVADLLDLVDGFVGHYVYVSSVMAYEQSQLGVMPWTEDMRSDTSGPRTYGGFKAMAEASMLERWSRTGFPVSIVRPAAIYGPHNNIFDMETPMFLRLLQHRPILLPHEGLVAGSYGHVDDLCAVMVAMVGNHAAHGEVFNVTAEAVTTRRYVDALVGIVGEEADVRMVPSARLADMPPGVFGHLFSARHHAVLSIAKAQTMLGFRPRFDFVTGHADSYRWFREQGWAMLDQPLSDPVWRASWDFAAEGVAAAMLDDHGPTTG